MMKAVMIEQFGKPPVCRELPEPEPGESHEVASVRAAAVKNIERMLAAGTHYASRRLSLPAPLGMDAVVELTDGRRVYSGAVPPGGAMSERMLVDTSAAVSLPQGVDDATAAALPNAGVSAWLALEHTGQLRPGQNVLILGATGVTGTLAVQLAKQKFGAGRVVSVGRDPERLEALTSLGADQTISITKASEPLGPAISAIHAENPFDLVLDFVWGATAEQTLRALGGDSLSAGYHCTRFVQIGESSGPEITLPASVLRSAGIELLGQGGGSVPSDALRRISAVIIPELLDMLKHRTLSIDTITRPFDVVTTAWAEELPSGTRLVLTP